MKTTLITIITLGLFLGSSPLFADNSKAKTTYQAVDMIALPVVTAPDPQGAAWLIRSRNKLQARVMVNVATAGDPYTIWWVIFNKPDKCIYVPCAVGPTPESGLADLLNPAVEVSIFSASGAISAHNGSSEGPAGVINVDVSTVAGVYPEDLFVLDFPVGVGTFGNKLNRGNGFGAEVHLVVDLHPELNSWVEELTTTNWGPNSNHRAAVFLAKKPSQGRDRDD